MTALTTLLTDLQDGILTITLNRPDRLNAWTGTMQLELRDVVIAAGNNADVRCIVVTGAGRGFCAGADMNTLQGIQEGEARAESASDTIDKSAFPNAPGPDITQQYAGRFSYMYACPKPIIAAINGPCAGIGLAFALYADLRFAAEGAKFTTAFAQRGLIAEHGMSWILPRLVGEPNALDILMTARVFLGPEAEEMGLVNKALPQDDLMGHVIDVATHLAKNVSPRSIAVMKRQVRSAYTQSFDEALAIADSEMKASFETFDFKEGVASFVERRPAAFKGE